MMLYAACLRIHLGRGVNIEHWQGVIAEVMTKMGCIWQINQWNVPQTAGEHLNTHVIHLQGLLGDWRWNYSETLAHFLLKSPVSLLCLMQKWNLISADLSIWWILILKSTAGQSEASLRDVQHVAWHWAQVCCVSDATWDSLNKVHPWPLSQSLKRRRSIVVCIVDLTGETDKTGTSSSLAYGGLKEVNHMHILQGRKYL